MRVRFATPDEGHRALTDPESLLSGYVLGPDEALLVYKPAAVWLELRGERRQRFVRGQVPDGTLVTLAFLLEPRPRLDPDRVARYTFEDSEVL